MEGNPTALRLEALEEESQIDESPSASRSNMFSESEDISIVQTNPMALHLEGTDEINVPHSNAETDSTFSHSSAEESGIVIDEQPNNGSSPPTAEILVRRSSTARHHVETAQLRFSGDEDDSDSEVVANPNTENI